MPIWNLAISRFNAELDSVILTLNLTPITCKLTGTKPFTHVYSLYYHLMSYLPTVPHHYQFHRELISIRCYHSRTELT